MAARIVLEKALPRLRANDETLQELNVTSAYMVWAWEGGEALANALERNNTLTKLHLDHIRIGDDGAKSLAAVLNENTTLTELGLTRTRIGGEGAQAIADALTKQSNTLTELNLSHSHIGGVGAKALADALKQNRTLRKLNLSSCRIDGEGAKALAGALKQNSTLVELNLSHNTIGRVGFEALADTLRQNRTLHKLNLRSTGIVAFALKQNNNNTLFPIQEVNTLLIGFFLRLNRRGRVALNSSIPIPLTFWEKITGGPPDILFFLLRNRAGLLATSSNDCIFTARLKKQPDLIN